MTKRRKRGGFRTRLWRRYSSKEATLIVQQMLEKFASPVEAMVELKIVSPSKEEPMSLEPKKPFGQRIKEKDECIAP